MNSAAYARRQSFIRKQSPGETTYDPYAPNKVCIADLILIYGEDGKTIQHIQDANSKPWFRQMPKSLAKVRQKANLLYGSTKTQIRCQDCGKLKSQKDLRNVGGRCQLCANIHQKLERERNHLRPKNQRSKTVWWEYPDGCHDGRRVCV